MSNSSFMCFDPFVPSELQILAANLAMEVRPENFCPNVQRAEKSLRFWRTGMVLRVRFLDGEDLIRIVMDAAASWSESANVGFEVVSDGDAEIRVTFKGRGNWSALGTDALVPELYTKSSPTMCLSEIPIATSWQEVSRLARHEFGHAIGLLHEHTSPAAGVQWNKPVVYSAMAEEPNSWSEEMVDMSLFERYSTTTVSNSTFDPNSVMLYAYPSAWTLDGQTFPENYELSENDREFTQKMYPGPYQGDRHR